MSERTCGAAGCGRPLKPGEKKYCPYHAAKRGQNAKVITMSLAGIGATAAAAVKFGPKLRKAVIAVAKAIITRRA